MTERGPARGGWIGLTVDRTPRVGVSREWPVSDCPPYVISGDPGVWADLYSWARQRDLDLEYEYVMGSSREIGQPHWREFALVRFTKPADELRWFGEFHAWVWDEPYRYRRPYRHHDYGRPYPIHACRPDQPCPI